MVNKMEKCLHPVLAKRDQNWFCSRIQAEMKQQGLGYLILQTPYNVMYATGYSPLVGSSAAIIPAEGDAHLIISTLESADAYASTNNVDVREFMSWVFIDNGTEESRRDKGDVMDPDAVVHMTIDLIKNTPMDGKVGIEMGSVSHAFYGKLAASLPEGMIVDGSSVTRNCRVVKCQWEIDMLRLAATEADKAWRAMAAEIKPGMPAWKLDAMFAYEASKLNLEHGTCGRSHSFIPAVGPYYGLCGVPRGYILQAGDVIKFDVGYSYFGYWSDIARTFAVGGTAPDEVLEIYDTLYKANRMGVEMLKPGTPSASRSSRAVSSRSIPAAIWVTPSAAASAPRNTRPSPRARIMCSKRIWSSVLKRLTPPPAVRRSRAASTLRTPTSSPLTATTRSPSCRTTFSGSKPHCIV